MGWLIERLLTVPVPVALLLVFLLPALEASLFVGFIFPGEIAILLGGVLAHEHRVSLLAVIALGAAGAILGDTIGYEVGRHYGDRLLARLPRRLVKPDHVERGKALLRRSGGRAVFIGRFTAALRVLIPGLAGTSGLAYPRFLAFNIAGAAAWSAETALIGYAAGASYRAAEHRLSLIGFGLLAVIILGYSGVRLRRKPAVRAWLERRISPTRWTGRPLTLLLVATIALGWLFGGVLQDVLGNDGIATYDPRWHADALTLRTPWLTDLAKTVTWLGATPIVWAALLVTAAVVLRHRRDVIPILIAVAALGSGELLRLLINHLVHRARPPRTDWLTHAIGYAWPSGHATTSLLGLGLILALTLPYLATRPRKAIAIGIAVVLTAAVGASRIYLGVHWVSDVLGGWLFGALWLTAATAALAGYHYRNSSRPTAHTPHRPGTDSGHELT